MATPADPSKFQLKFSEAEAARLSARILEDFRSANSDHLLRISKWAEYFRRWRAMVGPMTPGEEDLSNYPVPVCKWYANQKWAQNADSIFGDDAEIVAVPVGPSDYRNDKKIGAYMSWRVFQSMKLTNRLLQFELYKIIYGRVVAYSPWSKKSFDADDPKTGKTKENVYYKGPDFIVLEPDDFIAPAETAETLHDFSWVCRKVRLTPQQLLDGEQQGRYQGVKENFQEILALAYGHPQRSSEGDVVIREKDAAEGVNMENPMSSPSTVLVLEWFGRWRMLKRSQTDADLFDVDKRQLNESDIVVRILPEMGGKVIGAQDLRKLYPACPHPRPLVEASYQKDGSYWCDGLIQQLIDTEDEVRQNYNTATDGQGLCANPPVGYKPAQGFEPKSFKLIPGQMIPMDNPASDMKQMEFHFDLQGAAAREQTVLAFAERLTGMTDGAMGRQSDRPNAPRTARGQAMLLQQGNLRMTIDTVTLREDYAEVFQHFWLLETMFSDASTFFRVTEEDANGLFPVHQGGSYLEKADRDGSYDFRLKLATSQWSREANKEDAIACYQIDLQNPLIVQNPLALWKATAKAHKALGDPNFADMVPEPPHPDMPVNPKQEWAMIEQGESVPVNPLDNDQLHMIRHMQDLKQAAADQYADQNALLALKAHYVQHIHQLEQKKLVQAITERIAQEAQALGINPGGQMGQNGQPLPPGVNMPPGGTPITPPLPVAGSVAPPFIKEPLRPRGHSAVPGSLPQ